MEKSQCGSDPQKMINSALKTTDLSLCSKVFERLLSFFNDNDLLSSYQSGVQPSGSYIN